MSENFPQEEELRFGAESLNSGLETSIKLPNAEKFNGNPSQYQEFIASMNFYFWAKFELFQSDKSKIIFISSHLTGAASIWFGSLLQSNSEALSNFDKFQHEFERNFSDPSYQIKARGMIRKCKQGSRSVANYAAEFRGLARDTGFDQIALSDQFLRGLNDGVMDHLVMIDLPSTLEENINIAIRIDNRLESRKNIQESSFRNTNRKPFGNHNYHHQQNIVSETSQTPMEIDAISTRFRKPLTPEEKQRRWELGLCLYCGKKGHIAADCLTLRKLGKEQTRQ